MNGYCQLSALKSYLGVSSDTLDDEYVTAIEEASREFDDETRRHWYSVVDTRYPIVRTAGLPELFLDGDLLSLSALTYDDDGDYTYGTTLVVDTDYWLWPGAAPYRRIDLNSQSALLTSWDLGRRRVRVAGVWGASNEVEDTTLTGSMSSGGTTLTANANAEAIVSPGETLVLGSEQVSVSEVHGETLTVVPAINGTTAAAHTNATIYRRRYPRDIELAVKKRVAAMRWDNQGGYAGGDPDEDRDARAHWFRAIKRHRWVSV